MKKFIYSTLLTLFALFSIVGCGGGGGTNEATKPTITITGESTIIINKGEVYSDEGATAVDSSGASLTVVTTTDNVDTSLAGDYSIVYSATDGQGNSVTATRVVKVIDTADCVEVTNHIIEDTTWSASCYKVLVDLDIDATLTINKGTKVYFDVARKMRVDDGILIANGTEDEPILFTSEEHTRGYWDGLMFYGSNSTQNEISHITIEYAKVGLDVMSVGGVNSRLSISNSTFRENSEYGFKLNSVAILDKFENIHSYSNAISGQVDANALYALDGTSDFSGNDKDYIKVSLGRVENEQIWNALNIPVLFTQDVEIDVFVTIKAGASFLFMDNVKIRVDDGALEAIGTQDKPIIFTGNEKIKGYWNGILFYNTNDTKNALSFVQISYAKTALELLDTTRLKLSDNNLSYNENYGFVFDNPAILDEFSNMLIYENDIAGKLSANNVYVLDEASSFTGNTNDYIELTSYDLTKEQIWKDLTVPLFLTTSIDIDAFLTINAGASFLFAVDAGMRIDNGALTAIGTEVKPITFTGKQQTVGYWGSINFYGSQDIRNKMSYVDLSYGGSVNYGMLVLLGTDSTLELSNATISHSGGYGIETVCSGVINMSEISYENNTKLDFYRPDNCS